MDCLYISHTGMTEPLGRSQVLPYLLGLARRGFEIEILSHEPAGTPAVDLDRTRALIESAGINWLPQVRSPSHHLGTKLWESGRAALLGLAEGARRRPRIVHARSYLPAAVADLVATLTPRAKMLFDCRGMLGEEYVDAGHWTPDRVEYRLVKAFERRAFRRAEGLVVLTEALRTWMRRALVVPETTPITVVPCCVESERFSPDQEARREARRELGLGNRLTLVYSGSLGSWYQEEEMARFAKHLRRLEPELAWLVLTRSDTTSLVAASRRHGLDDLIIRSVPPADMPRVLPAGDLALSFIRPCFSKLGSSPTKVAEYLAAGMPVVVNAGIGDQAELSVEDDACLVARSYDDDELRALAARAVLLARTEHSARSAATRRVVQARFSLTELGIPRYEALYNRLLST